MNEDRARGVIYGLLVGDALGVPYEFHSAASLPPEDQLEMSPPRGFHRAHRGTPEGTWSDDGAQALALLDAANADGEVHEEFADRLQDWYRRGAFTPDGRVFDIGGTTSAAIHALEAGRSALEAGPSAERNLGNGSLMRAAPLAVVLGGEALIRASMDQSRVTHGHPVAQVCCAVYTTWVRGLLDGEEPTAAWQNAWEAVRRYVGPEGSGPSSALRAGLDRVERELDGLDVTGARGTGYVIHSLHAARHLLTTRDTYESVVKGAIALGDDTDTTAAIAGGAAGARFGFAAIPQRWLTALQGRAMVEELLAPALAG